MGDTTKPETTNAADLANNYSVNLQKDLVAATHTNVGNKDKEEPATAVNMTDADSPIVTGKVSSFNPFIVFRYHKFGPFIDGEYKIDLHKDANLFGGAKDITSFEEDSSGLKNNFMYYKRGEYTGSGDLSLYQMGENNKRVIENPSASTIIKWSKEVDTKKAWSYGPVPYEAHDFIYCKHYGKIPNNRLVTLRRYPIPVEDNVRVTENSPLVPLAQAVTWFGEGADNSLNDLIGLKWDIKWKSLEADVWDIEGNEITLSDILKTFNISGNTADAITAAYADTSKQGMAQLSGKDEKIRDWLQKAYEKGPYWNRVLGPVNVVNKTTIRDRGLGEKIFNDEINVTFTYSLRSFEGMNPKMAMLEIISNFLKLTYNTAPFWGGGYRYFKKTGVLPDQESINLLEEGKLKEATMKFIEDLFKNTSINIDKSIGQLYSLFSGLDSDDQAKIENNFNNNKIENNIAENFMFIKTGSLFKKPLLYQSMLEGRPIGEWHLTIGNPMNPIAVIGNLYVKETSMSFNETLGADDFPTEVSFKVTLGHGRPRAAQDIESIFNLGNGPMSFSPIVPSSASNTFGSGNSKMFSSIYKDRYKSPSADKGNGNKEEGQGRYSGAEQLNNDSYMSSIENDGSYQVPTVGVTRDVNVNDNFSKIGGEKAKAEFLGKLRERVTNHYGNTYGDSDILAVYLNSNNTTT